MRKDQQVEIYIKRNIKDTGFNCFCPDLNIEVEGNNIIELLDNLKDEILDLYDDLKDFSEGKMSPYIKEQKDLVCFLLNKNERL